MLSVQSKCPLEMPEGNLKVYCQGILSAHCGHPEGSAHPGHLQGMPRVLPGHFRVFPFSREMRKRESGRMGELESGIAVERESWSAGEL